MCSVTTANDSNGSINIKPQLKVIARSVGAARFTLQIVDRPCKQHCAAADSPHSRKFQAFLSPLPCNDDLHSDFRIHGPFGRSSFGFL